MLMIYHVLGVSTRIMVRIHHVLEVLNKIMVACWCYWFTMCQKLFSQNYGGWLTLAVYHVSQFWTYYGDDLLYLFLDKFVNMKDFCLIIMNTSLTKRECLIL